PIRVHRHRSVPQVVPGLAGPSRAALVDLVAVLFHSSFSQETEQVLRYTGERLNAGPVQPEDVVGANEANAEEGVGRILHATGSRVREAGEVLSPLALGQVL